MKTLVRTKPLAAPTGYVLWACFAAAALLLGDWPAGAEEQRRVDFDRDVRPILANTCFACHGPDPKVRKAGLRLDTKDGLFGKGKSAATTVTPADVSHSELIRRVTHASPDERMPPPEAVKQLTPSQIDMLRRWVQEGARFEQHWSFVAPVKAAPPAPGGTGWARNPVDAFVLKKLESVGFGPSPEADRVTLARRVSLDLTGLPPSIAEVDAFVNDRDPAAYERMVDRILASPHYGEKMAQGWLDVARYGDTNGFSNDSERQMWLWRDYVINAFNRNKPFDQFAVEQLAGDLIPDGTDEQKIASGFNRNTRFNEEGGADPEEFSTVYAVDRVNTLGTAFLGLTIECAQCHSHKYDPITQTEYYQLYAFFNSLQDPMVSGNHDQPLMPLLKLLTPEQKAAIAAAKAEAEPLDKLLAEKVPQVQYVDPGPNAWPLLDQPRDTVWFDDLPPDGSTLGAGSRAGDPQAAWAYVAAPEPVNSGKTSVRHRGKGELEHVLTRAIRPLRISSPDDKLFAYVYLDPKDPPRAVMLHFNNGAGPADDWEHRAFWGDDSISYAKGSGGPQHFNAGELPKLGEWVRLEVKASDVGLRPGTGVYGLWVTTLDGTTYFDKVGILSRDAQEPVDYVWADDAPPPTKQPPIGWEMVGAPSPVLTGTLSAKRSGKGFHQHLFYEAGKGITVHAGDSFFAHVWIDPKDPPAEVMLQFYANASFDHRAYWGTKVADIGGTDGTPSRLKLGPLPETGKWVRLDVDPLAVGLKPGDVVTGMAFSQTHGTAYWDTAGARQYVPSNDRYLVSQKAWETFVRTGGDPDVHPDIKAILEQPENNDSQKAALKDYYLRYVWTGAPADVRTTANRYLELQKTIRRIDAEAATTMVSQDSSEPRKAFVMNRGDFRSPGDEVRRDTPAFLPPMTDDMPRNRLGLARWVVDRRNPLPARVFVNRVWKQLFGAGLVRTAGDFGTQGQRPTHPELLDYLAADFMESGWDVKRLVRLIATSSAYRQSSRPDRKTVEADPENRLLARASRFRLTAEEIRDNALAAAGLLTTRVRGPSVKPYQPAGYYLGKYEAWKWEDSAGDDQYRRGLYTFWRRTALHPAMAVFDAPSREVCTADRPRTNTPLQALATLNEPGFVEAARVLAQRTLTSGGAGEDERLQFAFRSTVARAPTTQELGILRATVREQLAHYAKDPAAAKALVDGSGHAPRVDKINPTELAAWTAVSNVILNLDETITRE